MVLDHHFPCITWFNEGRPLSLYRVSGNSAARISPNWPLYWWCPHIIIWPTEAACARAASCCSERCSHCSCRLLEAPLWHCDRMSINWWIARSTATCPKGLHWCGSNFLHVAFTRMWSGIGQGYDVIKNNARSPARPNHWPETRPKHPCEEVDARSERHTPKGVCRTAGSI